MTVHFNRVFLLLSTGLPDSGFYSKILGFFEANGVSLGKLILAKNLGSFQDVDKIFEEVLLKTRSGFFYMLKKNA